NAAGPIDPPEMGCFAFNNNGFPFLFNSLYPEGTDRPDGARQQTNGSTWGVHTGGTNRSSYDDFVSRVVRSGWNLIIPYDFEMRFSAAGGYANWAFENEGTYHVPFELWNIGIDTPDEPSDDYRMIPWVLNDFGPGAPNDSVYNINPSDHAVSGGSNDPYMDWVYWQNPENTSPGTAGYDQFVSDALAGVYNFNSPEVMARTVLVNWNGGDVNDPTFPANVDAVIPEEGTVFRITTAKSNFPGDTLLVIASFTSIGKVIIPYEYELWQNYPNPFNPVTIIKYQLAQHVKVKLEVFNVLGQKVKTLVDKKLNAGQYTTNWDSKNEIGNPVGSGIYFYRIKAGDYVKTKKMVLMR
ncbi:MAG: T9SS type A sorting domain-containing protein, partial [Calditrichia bacterium]|nr:T9SS type A sorting domain-containing protein [Calditrichia bacterium]